MVENFQVEKLEEQVYLMKEQEQAMLQVTMISSCLFA